MHNASAFTIAFRVRHVRPPAATLQQLPPDEHFARVAREFIEAGTEYGAGFEFGLELILDGIERAQAGPG